MRPSLMIGLLVVAMELVGTATAGSPGRQGRPGEKGVWLERLQEALAGQAWTLELQGDEIRIRRREPVVLERIIINGPPLARGDVLLLPRALPEASGARPLTPMTEGMAPALSTPPPPSPPPVQEGADDPDGTPTPPLIRKHLTYVLRFGPPMGMAEYRRRIRWNEALALRGEPLEGGGSTCPGLGGKFNHAIAHPPEGARRPARCRKARARPPKALTVPDLFTPTASLTFFSSQDPWSAFRDGSVEDECDHVKEAILRLFGAYDPRSAFPARVHLKEDDLDP